MIDPAVNVRDVNTLRSTSGLVSRSSRTMNAMSAKTETTVMITIVCDENQSSVWPRSSTYCSDATPAVSRPKPIQSIGEVSRFT